MSITDLPPELLSLIFHIDNFDSLSSPSSSSNPSTHSQQSSPLLIQSARSISTVCKSFKEYGQSLLFDQVTISGRSTSVSDRFDKALLVAILNFKNLSRFIRVLTVEFDSSLSWSTIPVESDWLDKLVLKCDSLEEIILEPASRSTLLKVLGLVNKGLSSLDWWENLDSRRNESFTTEKEFNSFTVEFFNLLTTFPNLTTIKINTSFPLRPAPFTFNYGAKLNITSLTLLSEQMSWTLPLLQSLNPNYLIFLSITNQIGLVSNLIKYDFPNLITLHLDHPSSSFESPFLEFLNEEVPRLLNQYNQIKYLKLEGITPNYDEILPFPPQSLDPLLNSIPRSLIALSIISEETDFDLTDRLLDWLESNEGQGKAPSTIGSLEFCGSCHYRDVEANLMDRKVAEKFGRFVSDETLFSK